MYECTEKVQKNGRFPQVGIQLPHPLSCSFSLWVKILYGPEDRPNIDDRNWRKPRSLKLYVGTVRAYLLRIVFKALNRNQDTMVDGLHQTYISLDMREASDSMGSPLQVPLAFSKQMTSDLVCIFIKALMP